MPVFIAALLGGLASVAGSIVGRVLIALGIGYVSYTGVNVLLDWLKSEIYSRLNGAGSDVLGMLGTLQVDVSINILFSALAARFLLQGLTSGIITKTVIK